MTLNQSNFEKVIAQAPNENDHWDFKRQWYEKDNHAELIKDIINFVNTSHHDDCYLIIGIDDNTSKVLEVDDDKSRRNRQQLQDTVRNQPFAQNFYPRTNVNTYKINCPSKNKLVDIDVITIFNKNNTPVYLEKDI